MFEKSLVEKFKRIFDLKRVSFDSISESQEQEALFIVIQKATATIKDGRQLAEVSGKISIFANADKMPYGFFAKQIAKADPADTKDLFFYDLEENAGTIQNIVERTASFVFLFNSQYNPATGSITSINVTTVEN